MVYPWIYMDIHGISFDVYTWYICGISMDISGYSKLSETRFWCRPVLLVSFNAHTCVGDQECFIPRATVAAPPWQVRQGKRLPTKGLTRLPPMFPARRWWRRWRQRRRQVLQMSFCFLLRATTWILVKDGGEGAFRAGDQCVEQLRLLPVLKIEKKINFYLQGCGSCSSDEPERFDWMFVAIKLNSELSLSSDEKTANTWQFKVRIRTVSYWYLVETHSIPDQIKLRTWLI